MIFEFLQQLTAPMFADFGISGIIATVVLAAASTAAAAATAPGMPKTPDLGEASRAGVEAEAETLADRRRMEAAARAGTTATYTEHAHKEKVPMVRVSQRDDRGRQTGGKWVAYDPKDWEAGGKYSGPEWIKGEIKDRTTKVPESQQTVDFTGFGDADVQAQIAQGMAEVQLEMSKKYGTEFAREAARQLELADPEGTKARAMMQDLIQQQIDREPNRPVADLLQAQVEDELASGNKLTGMLDSVLADAVASGGGARGSGPQDPRAFAEPLETGFAGSQRLAGAQNKAMGWLSSGATPEDVAYRREQQNLANLGAFVSGETPVTQFRNLSGAQQGAAPFVPGAPLPQTNPNAGAAGQQFATNAWQQNLNATSQQADSWLAGLSMALQGVNAAAGAGKYYYKPPTTTPTV